MLLNANVATRRLLASLVIITLASGSVAHGQILAVRAPDRASAQREVNLFVDWEGRQTFEGLLVSMPAGWLMRSAVLNTYEGDVVELAPRSVTELPGRTAWIADGSVFGPGQIRLTVRVGAQNPQARWSIVPLERAISAGRSVYRAAEGQRTTRPLQIDPSVGSRGGRNQMLHLGRSAAGPELDGSRLPDLGSGAAYTLETWLRTTSLPGVVLSSWDGNERSDYAAELVIDRFGYPVFYQGAGGRHRAIRGVGPVADGDWHHVAVTHDPARRRMRLIVDGVAVDSLYGFDAIDVPTPSRLAIGHRVDRNGFGDGVRFDGDLEELRIWAVARDVFTVRSGMRIALPQPAAGAVILSFDDPIPATLLAGLPRRSDRQPSDLVFAEPIRDLRVRFEGGAVRLSWSGSDPEVIRYVVESASDGRSWQDIGSLPRVSGLPFGVGDDRSFEFMDVPGRSNVAFYRVRQEYAQGMSRESPAVKVGLGEQPSAWRATLEGNYPNPFNPTTTIRYRVDESMDLTVSVWDLSGQMIRILASGSHAPGGYSVPFTADDLPSGNYFIRLESGEGVQSRQMVLAR